jgi:hypothetical protein
MVGVYGLLRQADGSIYPSGKASSRQGAAEIAAKLDLIRQTEKHGLTVSPREVITGRTDARVIHTPQPAGAHFKEYAIQWLEGCRVRGLKEAPVARMARLWRFISFRCFGHLHLSQIDRKAVKAFVHMKLHDPLGKPQGPR